MWIEICVGVGGVSLYLYRYATAGFGKWEKLGINAIPGTFPWGSNIEVMTMSRHFNDVVRENYNKFKADKVFGVYLLGKPALYVNDPELIRHILVKDFSHFVDREDATLKKVFEGGSMDQFWQKQMTSLSGDEWKSVRSTFSPIFTSGKMKGMVKFIMEVGKDLTKELESLAVKGDDFEVKTVFGKFSLDAIANCAFGINPQSFKNESSVFVKNAARIFTTTTMDGIMMMSRFIPGVSWLHKTLGINAFKPKATKFFVDMLRDAVKQRRESGERRNDLIDLMIDCMKNTADTTEDDKGNEAEDQYEADMKLDHDKKSTDKEMFDEDTIVSTAMVLLVAGYDTTGMTLSFLSYQLSKNPGIQEKLQEEVDAAYEENDGNMPDYNTVLNLPYMEQCIMETLRHTSLIGALTRACEKPYTIPGTDIHLQKGDMVVIPAGGIHHDDRYYPNPEEFNPDHFSKESKAKRSPYTFLSFGQGPRACIGMRFAQLELKIALCSILRHYTFTPSDKTAKVIETDPTSDLGYAKGGLWVKITKRNATEE